MSGFDSSREQEARAIRHEQAAQAREIQALRDRDRKMVADALADTRRGPERVVWRGRSWFVAVGQDDGDHAHLTLTQPRVLADPETTPPERSESAMIDAANYTELELFIAGYLSTQPPHDREHPTLRLPTARRVLEIIGEWEPIDSFAPARPCDPETTP